MTAKGVALIFGVTGQDGSYLAEYLLDLGYSVTGVARRTSVPNCGRLGAALRNPAFALTRGDITDPLCVARLIAGIRPDEVYNLAAQSHVGDSFVEPSHTTSVTYGGALNCLEAIRLLGGKTKYYQASSSEMFGNSISFINERGIRENGHASSGSPIDAWQDENTPYSPCSPYAIAKLAAHHLCRVYRESYGLFACSGILFNHESPRRGENFVTRKITKYINDYVRTGGALPKLKLGNLDARRDWGHAKDFVRAMHLMLQQGEPDDYVIATGTTHSVYQFLVEAFKRVGITENLPYEIDQELYRPCEVPHLLGNAAKARDKLGWSPTIDFNSLVEDMVNNDGK